MKIYISQVGLTRFCVVHMFSYNYTGALYCDDLMLVEFPGGMSGEGGNVHGEMS